MMSLPSRSKIERRPALAAKHQIPFELRIGSMLSSMMIKPIDRDALRRQVREAAPFPHFCIDGFLDEEFADRVLEAFPSYEEALKMGQGFRAVNERGKVQVTDSSKFSEPIRELNHALASPEFLALMGDAFGIQNLLADEELVGGGIHETGPRGHLDVHVDFNYIEDRGLHRRINILIYLNKSWKEEWGGNIELWDEDVKVCHHSFSPAFNRCVAFETNEISYHGVTGVRCPDGCSRKSFAAYYYTKEAPPHWDGQVHSTIFRTRPDEAIKGKVLMPLEQAKRWMQDGMRSVKKSIRGQCNLESAGPNSDGSSASDRGSISIQHGVEDELHDVSGQTAHGDANAGASRWRAWLTGR
jgi:Rps23 Pro-64 3,4-dihydroxylase Tpa1-like proline 4-hydroxylase